MPMQKDNHIIFALTSNIHSQLPQLNFLPIKELYYVSFQAGQLLCFCIVDISNKIPDTF